MAERRLSSGVAGSAATGLPAFRPRPFAAAMHPAWFVQDAGDAVLQPFYAALDRDRRVCWTDDLDHAERFGSKVDAERFIRDRVTTEARVIVQA